MMLCKDYEKIYADKSENNNLNEDMIIIDIPGFLKIVGISELVD